VIGVDEDLGGPVPILNGELDRRPVEHALTERGNFERAKGGKQPGLVIGPERSARDDGRIDASAVDIADLSAVGREDVRAQRYT
jgi:hypothetical protein